ncbi:type VI secretion system baseplate subunit TssK [Azohydromonas caseinilytica]|uniref:Type VI secretion system baseplate subunit TssK n=1 Tax=Azohydromonas caseinilytica TaxID=2728836 RepID=A0A848FJH0_9BURK|nr:type VI secretion system baseplate subunit TssK [Azohydromonas caseinilytica]NML19035.1 type VI secretion system baseplate subunit TssK [Azohydromonas caseinilytica]
MIRSAKVLWGEGLFLRPQHFQRQDAYHEWRQAEIARALHPYSWGIRELKFDTGALLTGVLRITELRLIFPDGELYSAPHDDDLPDPLSLSDWHTGATEAVLYLAMAPMRSVGANFSQESSGASTGMRYALHEETAHDWFTESAEMQLSTLRRRVRLLSEQDAREHLISLPLLRLRRRPAGGVEIDASFIPPSLSLAASPALQDMLRGLLDTLHAKANALYGVHREPSRHVIEFRSGDVASFWLLHTCNAAFAALSHLYRHPLLHPERLFERMLELAGALTTFSRSYSLADLPAYDHDKPAACFAKLENIVRDLLDTVISTRYFSIALQEVRSCYYQGRLDSQKINSNTWFLVGVQARLPAAELVELIPHRFKIGAPDDVEKLVLSATHGVRLVHTPQVPAAIPVRPNALYFSLDCRGPLYERMLQSGTLTLYTPSGLPDLQLELFALNDAQ